VPVDYTSHAELVSALRGTDVVIATLGGVALLTQIPVAHAAAEAGVSLFVPSEFGNPTEGNLPGLHGMKVTVQRELTRIGLPFTLFWNGPFSDFIFIPYALFPFCGR
jgi:hypothetical protein